MRLPVFSSADVFLISGLCHVAADLYYFCLYFHPMLKIHWPETCIPARSSENSLLWTCRITPSELGESTKRFNNTGGRLTKIFLAL